VSYRLPRDTWFTAGISITLLLLLTLFMYQHSVLYLIGKWNQLEAGEYGHGYLVLLISLYLVFDNRQKLKAMTPCPEYRAVLAVLGASVLWLSAALVDIETIRTVGLFLLIASVIWAVLGNRVMRLLIFPVFYIIFAIPAWFPLSPLLQEFTADVVFWLIRVMEIPALRIENMIVLPAGRLSVEEACSGRLMVVLISAAAAVLANIVRVFIVVYLGYSTEMQHPLISDHLMFGWYLFGGVVAILLVSDMLLHKGRSHGSDEEPDTEPGAPVLCQKAVSKYVVVTLLCAFFVSAGPAITFLKSGYQPVVSSSSQVTQLLEAGKWSVIENKQDDWMPQYHGAIEHKVVLQDNKHREVSLYLGLYPVQTQGKELIYYLNKISDGEIWHARYQRAKRYDTDGLQVLEQVLQKDDGSQLLVWYWYHVAGQDVVNKYHAKVLQLLGFINGKQQASVVAVAARLDGEAAHTREILTQFTVDMKPSLLRVIDDR